MIQETEERAAKGLATGFQFSRPFPYHDLDTAFAALTDLRADASRSQYRSVLRYRSEQIVRGRPASKFLRSTFPPAASAGISVCHLSTR